MRIYYDETSKNIVLGSITRLFASGSLIAYAEDGRVAVVYIANNFRELHIRHTQILREDGSPAGSTITAVIDYLNAEFSKTPFVDVLVQSVNGISKEHIVLTALDVGAIAETEKGAANGVATLGADSKIPAAQLPAYVDDVLEFANLASFPLAGESGKIYVSIDTGLTYRWSGSQYIEISAAPVTQVNGKVGIVTLTTSDIAEGSNLYLTASRVRDTILTGLSLTVATAITSADSVLSAFGKLQKQLTDHFAAVDPHPQYTTDAEATAIAQARIAAHEAPADPHPQYMTQTETDARIQNQRDVFIWPGTGSPTRVAAGTRWGRWHGSIVSSAGTITFNVTADGTAGGTPLFTNLSACIPHLTCVRDTDLNNESPWAHVRRIVNNRQVVVQVKKSNTGPVVLLGSYSGNLNNTNQVSVYLSMEGVLA
jgi:hypothetical protein